LGRSVRLGIHRTAFHHPLCHPFSDAGLVTVWRTLYPVGLGACWHRQPWSDSQSWFRGTRPGQPTSCCHEGLRTGARARRCVTSVLEKTEDARDQTSLRSRPNGGAERARAL
jgi:hypothetical protein